MKKINKLGFTIIELLAVITILGLLSSVVVLSINKNRESSRKKEVIALKQAIIAGYNNYRIDHTVNKDIEFPIDNLRFTPNLSYGNNYCSNNVNNTIKYVIKGDIDSSDSLEEVYCISFTCNEIPVIDDYTENSTYCN